MARRLRGARDYLRRNALFHRETAIRAVEKGFELQAPQRVAVALAHVAPLDDVAEPERRRPRLERLRNTIDGLMMSFAAHELSITVCTATDHQVVEHLPEYQRNALDMRRFDDCDPMHVGFRAHDVLADAARDSDWLLFIEDDIVIQDGCFLDKLAAFNRAVRDPRSLLLPNRFELHEGRKTYIDLTICENVSWDGASAFEDSGMVFAECSNPHAGMFCMAQEQVTLWGSRGRSWRDEAVMVSPLETAATLSLLECFRLFKAAPPNLAYLEVRHFDTKYSWPITEMAEPVRRYSLSAIPRRGSER
jgi:hypothetical protein